MADRIDEVLEGKYRLRRVLGRGGMGVVYEAEHVVISRRMAVKMLHGEHVDSDEMAQRFLQEAKSASTIRHPNVIEIQDVGRSPDGAIFIVMELLEGRSLGQVLSGNNRLAPAQAVAITRQILAGLGAAHAARIVHRDLKPDNVFLASEQLTGRPGQRVKILDFGISKGVAGGPEVGLTRTGTVLGTAWYMAPEQARGEKDLDERADIWAVGVMLHQMLVGALPFAGDSYNAVIAQILTEPVPSCLDLAPDLDPALAAVVQKALAKDRTQRYGSAAAFDEALTPFAPGPVETLSVASELEDKAGTAAESTAKTVAASAGTEETVAAIVGTEETVAVDAGTAKTVAAEPSAPFAPTGSKTPHAPADEPSDEPPGEPPGEPSSPDLNAPLWKRVLWYAILLPVLSLFALILIASPLSILRAFGLPAGLPVPIAYVMTAVLVAGLGWCALLAARAWQSGRTNRWLHGAAVVVAPALGLGLALLHYLTLRGQKTSHQVTLRAYSAITDAQAARMARLIGESHEQFLHAVTLNQVVLALLGLVLLLGWLFQRPDVSGTPLRPTRWLVLPAGYALIGLAHFVIFPRQLRFMGILFYACYLLWTLATVVTLRQRAGSRSTGVAPGWAALATTLATSAGLTGLQVALGYVAMFGSIAKKPTSALPPAEREVMFNVVVNPSMLQGVLLQWVVLLALFGLTWLFGRRALAWPGRHARQPLLVFAAVFVITALPTPILLWAMSSASDQWAPHKFAQMQPVARAGEKEPTFYMDRAPQSLAEGHRLLYWALTQKRRHTKPTVDKVHRALKAHQACPKILTRALRQTGDAEPARCVTAIEARIYCEQLGKRLPTPREWDTALAKVMPRGPGAGTVRALTRGDFGEWTMQKEHGTATFEIRGQAGATGATSKPWRLAPNRFSKRVGFRCAFTFPGD